MNLFNREKVLAKFSSAHGVYEVVDMVYEGRKARVLFSGDRGAAFSAIPLDGNNEMLFDYMRRFYELAIHLKPKRILIIGGGTYTLPMQLQSRLKGSTIDVVEIDKELKDTAIKYFGLKASKNLNIIHQPGEIFLKNSVRKYDLILIDAFEKLSIPAALSPNKISSDIYKALNLNGVFAINIISPYKGRAADPLRRQVYLLKKQFETVKIFPAERNYSGWMSQNLILLTEMKSGRNYYGITSNEVLLETD